MNLDEWLDAINILQKRLDNNIKDKLLNEEDSENLHNKLEIKLEQLIKERFNKNVKKLISSLDYMVNDHELFELELINYKKQVKFLYELCDIKVIGSEKSSKLKYMLMKESNNVYEILINEASNIDRLGVIEQIIKNNRIKWRNE